MKDKGWVITCLLGLAGCPGAGPMASSPAGGAVKYDATSIPKGTGWHCYEVSLDTGGSLSNCFRNAEVCAGSQRKLQAKGRTVTDCNESAEAYCVTYVDPAKNPPVCSMTLASCRRWRGAEDDPTSECTAEP